MPDHELVDHAPAKFPIRDQYFTEGADMGSTENNACSGPALTGTDGNGQSAEHLPTVEQRDPQQVRLLTLRQLPIYPCSQ